MNKKRTIIAAILLFASVAAASVGIQSGASISANNWFVNTFGAGIIQKGRSARTTYVAVAGGLATTAAFSMQLEAEVSRGFHIAEICVATSNATAAALQTVIVRRMTTAASGGTVLTPEGTAAVAVSQMVPGSGNWAGGARHGGTAGTAGALLDYWGWSIGEVGAGAADPPGPTQFCKKYGQNGEQMPYVASGTSNGVNIAVTASGGGGLASGAISVTFIAE